MEGYNLYQLYVAGGLFMHPIFACLLVGIGISFERLRTLKRASINTHEFLAGVKRALIEDGLRPALDFCEKTNGPVAVVCGAGLQRAPRGLDHVEKAMMNASAMETAHLEKNLIWLSLFISLTPLLGIAGTVLGIIKTLGQASAGNLAIIAHGVAVALLTTLFGVLAAILFKMAHNFFSNLIDKLVLDMETSSAELIEMLVEMEYQAQFPHNQIGQA